MSQPLPEDPLQHWQRPHQAPRTWKPLAIGVTVTVALLLFFVAILYLLSPEWATGRTKSQGNLVQIALAMVQYESTYKRLPPAVVSGKDGQPLYSWRVLLLPYLEERPLYEQFKRDEPWDSPTNKPLLAQMPEVYAPVRGRTREPYSTFYQVFVGPGAAFEGLKPMRFPEDFPDGVSKTILVVEAGEAVPWTKPEDLPYAPGEPLPRLGGLFEGGFNAAFADGSVRFIGNQTDEKTLRSLITRNGRERVDWDQVK
jgi:prepilin-type processing-associated H-X9-DG protein